MAFSLTKIIKGLLIKQEGTLTPNAIQILPGGTASTTTTVQGAQTADRTLTLPDATDTLTGKATTDTLTNKSIDATTNTITNLADANIKSAAAIDATKIADGTVSSTEFQYLNTVTSNIQDQLDSKAPGASAVTLNGTQTLTNKSLVDSSTAIVDASDATKMIAFDAGGTTATSTIIAAAQTTNRIVTLPDATDTLVGKATTDTLTNKTLTAPVINSPTGITKADVGLSNVDNTSDATKNSATTTLTNKSLVDSSTAIVDATDATKTIKFDAAGTTGTSTTLLSSQTTNKILTLPDATDTLVGKNTTDVLTNKTLTAPVVDALTMTQISTPANPSAGSNKIYTKADGSAYILASDGTETKIGSGGTGVNLIVGGDAEGLNPFLITHNTVAAARPDSGFVTSGTTITTSISATNPLNGTKSFLITKPASNAQGNQASIPFTVPLEMRAKALTITLPYIVNSGTFVAGTSTTDSDAIIYIYDVTNSTFIEPSSIKFLSNNSSISSSVQATFQTSVTGSSYKLLVHIATTSAVAWELKADDIQVSPANYQYGTPATDMQMYTPTFTGFGTVSGVQFGWARHGDQLLIAGKFTSGVSTGVEARVSLPPGLTVDSTKVAVVTLAGKMTLGFQSNAQFSVLSLGGLTYLTVSDQNNTGGGLTNRLGTDLVTTGQILTFQAIVPIQGWSSSVQTSDQTDTRAVASLYNTATGTLGVAYNNITFTNKISDTHASMSGSTYTIPVSGYYNIAGLITVNGTYVAGNQLQLQLSKNGTGIALDVNTCGGSVAQQSVNCLINSYPFNAGDTITAQSYCQATGPSYSGVNQNYLSIARISGPSAIAASESIYCRYENSAGTSITGSFVNVPFITKIKDTHGAFNGSTGIFTAPISGMYSLESGLITTSVNLSTSQGFAAEVVINGATVILYLQIIGSGTTNPYPLNVKTSYYLLAGQTMSVQMAAGVSTSLNTTLPNFICITRTGN